MTDVNRRIKNCNRLYLFLLTLAIFTGCWCFLLLTIPVLCRLYYLFKLKGVYSYRYDHCKRVYDKYNKFQQLYKGDEGYVISRVLNDKATQKSKDDYTKALEKLVEEIQK